MVPEALLTAMHDPSSGSRLAAAPGDSEAGLWLRMVRDVLADTRGIGAAAVLDATGACVGGDANKYATRLSTSPRSQSARTAGRLEQGSQEQHEQILRQQRIVFR